MTDDPGGGAEADGVAAGDPRAILLAEAAPGPVLPWYRRRATLVAGVAVVVLAITVVTDLPTTASRADNLASAEAFVKEVNQDLGPCTLAVTQAIAMRRAQLDGTLSASDRASAASFLLDDAEGCSAANPLTNALLGIDEPGSSVHTELASMYEAAIEWTADGEAVVTSVQGLVAGSSTALDATALGALGCRARDRSPPRRRTGGRRRRLARLDAHPGGAPDGGGPDALTAPARTPTSLLASAVRHAAGRSSGRSHAMRLKKMTGRNAPAPTRKATAVATSRSADAERPWPATWWNPDSRTPAMSST